MGCCSCIHVLHLGWIKDSVLCSFIWNVCMVISHVKLATFQKAISGWTEKSPAHERAVRAGSNPCHPESGLFSLPSAKAWISRMLCSRPWGDNIWGWTGQSFCPWCLNCVNYSTSTNASYLALPLSFHTHHHHQATESKRLWGKEPGCMSEDLGSQLGSTTCCVILGKSLSFSAEKK